MLRHAPVHGFGPQLRPWPRVSRSVSPWSNAPTVWQVRCVHDGGNTSGNELVLEPLWNNTSQKALAGTVIMNLLDQSSPEGKKTMWQCHSRPPVGRLQYRPFIPPLMGKDRICHKSDCPILGTLSRYASKLCWHFSRWESELKLNTAASSPDYCCRQQWDSVLPQSAFSAFGPWADQIKCFITPQSIQSLLHFLSLCLIWHLYLFSDSIHPLGATFYCLYSCSSLRPEPNTDTNIWQGSLLLRKLHYIWACLHAHYITN